MKSLVVSLLVLVAARTDAASLISTSSKNDKVLVARDGATSPLVAGSEITSGDLVYVDSGLAQFRLDGGARLVAQPGARFIPKDTPESRDGQVKLLSGELVSDGNRDASVSTTLGLLLPGDGGIMSVMYAPPSLEIEETLQIMTQNSCGFVTARGIRISIPDASKLIIREGYVPVISKLSAEELAQLELLSKGAVVSDTFAARKSAGSKPLPGGDISPQPNSMVEIAPGVTLNTSQLNVLSNNGEGSLN